MNSKIVYLLAAVLLIVSAFFTYGYINAKATIKNFRQNGIQTTATIAEVYQKRSRELRYSLKVRYKRRYYIKVTYFTRSNEVNDTTSNTKLFERNEQGKLQMNLNKKIPKIGEFVSTLIGVDRQQYNRLKKGERIEVVYLPNEIDNAMLMSDLQ